MTLRTRAGIMPGMSQPRLARLLEALRAGGPTARRRALAELARRGERAAGPEVARLLRDPLPALRAEAARALSRLGTEAEVSVLLEALDDPEADVRYWAAVALGNLASPAAVLALIRLARREPVAEVREAAREAIPKTAW